MVVREWRFQRAEGFPDDVEMRWRLSGIWLRPGFRTAQGDVQNKTASVHLLAYREGVIR
jgi:hypothetical protein